MNPAPSQFGVDMSGVQAIMKELRHYDRVRGENPST